MTPQPSIAHYRITSKLGEGGMGAVYRATDTKLNRDVAIKVLPESFAADPDRLARFTREAQVLASLNHPNIAAIHGVEERAIVMELVEGQTLGGPLSPDDALPLIYQLIDALEYAHERGVVHRDLKPANIKVTPEARVKVLDFGLAKAISGEASAPDGANSPTLTMRATLAGAIMGTAAYMAPEQARGKPVDKRADIWAFGVVLYEILTGRPLFDADNVSDTLVQVLSQEPDLNAVPPRFRPLLHRCLERDPRKRLRDIGDARAILEEATPAEAIPLPRSKPWVWMAVAALALVLGIAGWLRPRPGSGPAELYHFAMDIDEARVPRLSPNGRWMVFSSTAGLRVRSLDSLTWRTIPETEGATQPFWSTDSTAIGFFSGGRLRTTALSGGSPRNLAAAPNASGGDWRGNISAGTILFASGGSLHSVDVVSGKTLDLPLRFAKGERPAAPAFLPQGDGFVYLVEAGGKAQLLRSSLASTAMAGEPVLDTRRGIAFAPNPRTGDWYMLYVSPDQEIAGGPGGTVFARQIDPRTGAFRGPATQTLDAMVRRANSSDPGFTTAESGAITWRWTSTSQPIWRLRWFDRLGSVIGSIGALGQYVSIALSPDETKLAVLQGYPVEHTWLYDLATGASSRLSNVTGNEGNSVWSPDSRTLYYTVATEAYQRIVRQTASSGSPPEVLYEEQDPRPLSLRDITPDGKALILVRRCQEADCGIVRFDLSPGAPLKPEVIVPNQAENGEVRISPDGRTLVFSNPTGFYATSFPPGAAEAKPITSLSLGMHAFFSRDGGTLYFLGQRTLVAQPVTAIPGGGIRLGERSTLFPVASGSRIVSNLGAVTRDGKRFLIISADESEELKVHFLSDWSSLLKP